MKRIRRWPKPLRVRLSVPLPDGSVTRALAWGVAPTITRREVAALRRMAELAAAQVWKPGMPRR